MVHPSAIGKFRVTGLLGRGAMGVVYKAHDPDIDRTVAIKLVRSDLLDSDDRDHHVARLRNEAKMVGRCVHPNIVGIYEFATHEGAPFLVLEYVDGKHLGQIYRRGVRVDLGAVTRLALGILEALSFAHGFGVIHRDIKPGNIMLSQEGHLKITDFGISRALASDAARSSVLIGTPSYMSPEQCMGDAIDTRSDLFSLGCVLFELLAGERAFEAANYVATAHKILHATPASLHALRPDLPEAVCAVVERALAKRPDERFADAAAMAAGLRSAILQPSGAADADADATVVLSPLRPQSEPRGEIDALTDASRRTIERQLAHHVGPIGRYLVRRALIEQQTPEGLAEQLAAVVPQGRARDELRRTVLATIEGDDGLTALRSRPGTPAGQARSARPAPLAPATVEAATRALAQIVGPIASRLIERALATSTSPEELRQACLAMVEQPRERERLRELLVAGVR